MRSYLFQFIHSFKENVWITFCAPDIVLAQQCVPCSHQSYSPQMSAQSDSEAVQIQGKLHILLSLTSVCPVLARHYAEKFLPRKKKL